MTLRSRARSFLIEAATLFRADQLALHRQQRRRRGLVIAVHETPEALKEQFRNQLEWASRHFAVCSLEKFVDLCYGKSEDRVPSKPPILFTFDDGRESNYAVAAPLLESIGARGVFFIVPEFSECSPRQALDFYRSNINPNSRPGDEAWEDWKPMSPAQVADLAARGHAIGNHTLTHPRLSRLDAQRLEHEIGDSARKLTAWTGKPVEAFAWTFGWDAIDRDAWRVICRYHKFCFAPCPGAVEPQRDRPTLIWRREIEVKYSPAECRFLYSGLGDFWWSTRRNQLRKMLQPRGVRSTSMSS